MGHRLAIVLIADLVLAGCATLNLERPDVHLVDLRLGPTEGLSQVLEVELVVVNPNTVGLKLDAIRYGLSIEGHRLASGTSVEPLAVPAGGEARYTIPVRLSLLAGVDVVRRLLSGPLDGLGYQLEAELIPRRGLPGWTIQREDVLSLSP